MTSGFTWKTGGSGGFRLQPEEEHADKGEQQRHESGKQLAFRFGKRLHHSPHSGCSAKAVAYE